MNDPSKSDDYKNNLDSLIKAIKLGNVEEVSKQYNRTVSNLSQALEGFTNKAKDVAKFVIRDDLDNYVKLMNKKPSGFGILKGIVDRILGRNVQIENISNFVNKLPRPTLVTAIEHLDVSKKISDLEQGEKSQKKHLTNLGDRTTSKQKESTFELQKEEQPKRKLGSNRIKKMKRSATAAAPDLRKEHFKSKVEIIPSGSEGELSYSHEDSGYESSLGEEPGYEEISKYQEGKNKVLTGNSQNLKLPGEEPIYATIPKEHIEAKRTLKQEQKTKPPIPPKPSIAPPAPKKMFAADRKVRQKPQVAIKNKSKVPLGPKNLGCADQEVNTKSKVVGVVLKKSAESKPTIPLKSESQDHRQSAQRADDSVLLKVASATMEKGINRKMGSKVKALKEKFEQNQVKENVNVQPVKSKIAPIAQADTGVKKDSPKTASQFRSFSTRNKRSTMNPTAKSDPKPPVSKKPFLTHVSVKEIAARFESHGKK